MQLRGWRLVAELTVAAILGLAPLLFGWSNRYFAHKETEPRTIARASFALANFTSPGSLVGRLVESTLGACGIADLEWRHEQPADGKKMGWRTAQKINNWTSVVANVLIFAATWFLWRSGGRLRMIAKAITLTWLIFMLPLCVFSSLWTVYSP